MAGPPDNRPPRDHSQSEFNRVLQGTMATNGDSGAAGCDSPSTSTATASAIGVNGLCSTPYSTCVGGTQFSDSNAAAYWSSSTNATTMGSALSYIPEAAWNSSGMGSSRGRAMRLVCW